MWTQHDFKGPDYSTRNNKKKLGLYWAEVDRVIGVLSTLTVEQMAAVERLAGDNYSKGSDDGWDAGRDHYEDRD